jgi:hypothetical protein
LGTYTVCYCGEEQHSRHHDRSTPKGASKHSRHALCNIMWIRVFRNIQPMVRWLRTRLWGCLEAGCGRFPPSTSTPPPTTAGISSSPICLTTPYIYTYPPRPRLYISADSCIDAAPAGDHPRASLPSIYRCVDMPGVISYIPPTSL